MMTNQLTRTEGEIYKRARKLKQILQDSVTRKSDVSLSVAATFMSSVPEQIYSYFKFIGGDNLKQINPSAEQIVRAYDSQKIKTREAILPLVDLCLEVMPKIWRVRRYRQTRALSPKLSEVL